MAKLVDAADLRARSDEDLTHFLREKREELFKLKLQHHTGQLENVSRLRLVKREIARALLVLDEKKRRIQS